VQARTFPIEAKLDPLPPPGECKIKIQVFRIVKGVQKAESEGAPIDYCKTPSVALATNAAYNIKVIHPDYDGAPLFVESGEAGHPLQFTLTRKPGAVEPSGPSRPIPAIVTLAVLSAVGIGLGLGGAVAAENAFDDAEKIRAKYESRSACSELSTTSDCAALMERSESQTTWTRTAIISFSAGALCAGVAAALVFWPTSSSPPASVSVGTKIQPVPIISAHSTGIGLVGRF
jgi:hypothetical protein